MQNNTRHKYESPNQLAILYDIRFCLPFIWDFDNVSSNIVTYIFYATEKIYKLKEPNHLHVHWTA